MPHHLRFIDPCAPLPYADVTDMPGFGGDETTLVHIATALASDMEVTVEQAARRVCDTHAGVRYLPMDLTWQAGHLIVVVNSWKVALVCRRTNPQARICIWQHVVPGRHNRVLGRALAQAGIEIITVSQTLAVTVSSFLDGQVRVTAIPNAVADDLHPDATPRDRDLLLFAGARQNGLDQVAAAFTALRAKIPGLRLEVAGPACATAAVPDGTTPLGRLTHDLVLAKMRQASCLFHPQTQFAEPFSLVIAGANAVGCPALVQRGLGANDEVTSTAEQCIDAANLGEILDRISQWRCTSPAITLLPQFRKSAILARWHRFMQRDRQDAALSDALFACGDWPLHCGTARSTGLSLPF